jgi:hypothetical protein
MNSIRPWFVEDIMAVLKGVLFATGQADNNNDYERGFLACAIAICKAIGADPEELKR